MKRKRIAWRATLRLVGWLPVAGSGAGIALLMTLNATVWRGAENPPLPPARVVETIVPLAVGLQAAFLLSAQDERPLELLLTVPRPLALVLGERLLLMAALQGSVALAGSLAGLAMAGEKGLLLATVRWLAPSAFIGGTALFVTQWTRSGVLGALVAAVLWGGMLVGGDALPGQVFFLRPVHPYLQPESVALVDYARNRISLALAGGALTALGLALTRGEEHVLGVYGWEKTNPRDFAWLALGSALLLFSAGRWTVPLAAWLSPVFILRFTRKQTRHGWGTPLAHLAMAATVYAGWSLGFALSDVGHVILALFYGLYLFLPYLADRLIAPRLGRVSSTLVFPLAWVTLEVLHAALSPLPTPMVAYTQHGNLPLAQVAAVTGAYGVTFLVTWLAPVVNRAWERAFDWREIRSGAGLYATVLALALLLGGARLTFHSPESQTMRVVSIVETGSAAYLGRSAQEAQAGARIVAWPEAAVAVTEEMESALVADGSEVARREGIYLALGVASRPAGSQRAENKAVLLDPSGEIAWEYLESRPIPGPESFRPGDGVLPVLDTPDGRLGTAIGHDLAFPTLIRQAGAAGVDLLLAPADGFEGAAGNQPPHLAQAAFRAIENGFSVVHPSGTRPSVALDYQGRVLATMDPRATADRVMMVHVPVQGVTTAYAQVGDLFAWLCVAGFVGLVLCGCVTRPLNTHSVFEAVSLNGGFTLSDENDVSAAPKLRAAQCRLLRRPTAPPNSLLRLRSGRARSRGGECHRVACGVARRTAARGRRPHAVIRGLAEAVFGAVP